MAGSVAQDAVARYLANRKPPEQPVTAKQRRLAEEAGQRRGEAANRYYADRGHPIASFQPTHTTRVKVDEKGNPVFGGDGDSAGPQQDWSSYLGMFGLPADVLKEINAIFQKTPDIGQAVVRAQAYVRGTPWYAQTYPGIREAIAKGIVRDEQDYRRKQNEFDQVFRQWTSNGITTSQYAQFLKEGVDAATVERRFAGDAFANAGRNDWQYLAGNFGEGRLSDDDVKALGRQQAGLGSARGINLQSMLEKAQQRLQRVSEGTLATLVGDALGAPQQDRRPDIGR